MEQDKNQTSEMTTSHINQWDKPSGKKLPRLIQLLKPKGFPESDLGASDSGHPECHVDGEPLCSFEILKRIRLLSD